MTAKHEMMKNFSLKIYILEIYTKFKIFFIKSKKNYVDRMEITKMWRIRKDLRRKEKQHSI